MPPFRFNIPFFSYGSPSRPSSGTSSPSPPPTPPSRPPFRPAGISQPPKPSTSQETKSKVPSSLSKEKRNVEALAASSSEFLKAGEKKVAMKEKSLKEIEKEGVQKKKISPVTEKPSIARSERKVAEEAKEQRKKTEVEKLAVVEMNSKTAQELQKKREKEKLAVEEKKKLLSTDTEENSKAAQEQQKKNETEKLAAEEKMKLLHKDMEENSKTAQEQQKRKETEKLALEEKKKLLSKDMEENSKTAQEQQKSKEIEKLAVEEKKKNVSKNMEENSKTAQEQQMRNETEKLALQERTKSLQAVGEEHATGSKPARHISFASESTRGPRDLPERKTQNRTNHTDTNHQKTTGISTANHENLKDGNREGSSSMSRKIKEDIRDGISKLTCGKSNNDDKSVSVYTLTGENRGATMAIGSEKDSEIHIRRGYKSNPDESPNTTATETEEERSKNPKDDEAARVRAYVNGNTQAINNSIVLECSVSENDPGVHMSLKFEISKKETANPPAKKSETVKTTEKLRNEPRVRRRCLRGLLAESSESENPLKPRRHGCKFTCKDKDIENT